MAARIIDWGIIAIIYQRVYKCKHHLSNGNFLPDDACVYKALMFHVNTGVQEEMKMTIEMKYVIQHLLAPFGIVDKKCRVRWIPVEDLGQNWTLIEVSLSIYRETE